MKYKNKSKILKIFFLSLISLTNLSLTINLANAKNRNKHSLSNNKNNHRDKVNSGLANDKYKKVDIDQLTSSFPWLEKYCEDQDFANSDFNAYMIGDVIKKGLADQYFLQAMIALVQFIQYVANTYPNLKFSYTRYTNILLDNGVERYLTERRDVIFDQNYFEQCKEIEWESFFVSGHLKFYCHNDLGDPNTLDPNNDLVEDFKFCFFDDVVNGVYYIEQKDKDDANNQINLQINKKIKELKSAMDYCKKQFDVFKNSIEQPSLAPNEELNELMFFLGKIVTANSQLIDDQAIAKDEDNILRKFVDYIHWKSFSDWSGAYYNYRNYIHSSDKNYALIMNNNCGDFFNYLYCKQKKNIENRKGLEEIDFKEAINDFLDIAETNQEIFLLEKAVASYMLAILNKKGVITFDGEEHFMRYFRIYLYIFTAIVATVSVIYVVDAFGPMVAAGDSGKTIANNSIVSGLGNNDIGGSSWNTINDITHSKQTVVNKIFNTTKQIADSTKRLKTIRDAVITTGVIIQLHNTYKMQQNQDKFNDNLITNQTNDINNIDNNVDLKDKNKNGKVIDEEQKKQIEEAIGLITDYKQLFIIELNDKYVVEEMYTYYKNLPSEKIKEEIEKYKDYGPIEKDIKENKLVAIDEVFAAIITILLNEHKNIVIGLDVIDLWNIVFDYFFKKGNFTTEQKDKDEKQKRHDVLVKDTIEEIKQEYEKYEEKPKDGELKKEQDDKKDENEINNKSGGNIVIKNDELMKEDENFVEKGDDNNITNGENKKKERTKGKLQSRRGPKKKFKKNNGKKNENEIKEEPKKEENEGKKKAKKRKKKKNKKNKMHAEMKEQEKPKIEKVDNDIINGEGVEEKKEDKKNVQEDKKNENVENEGKKKANKRKKKRKRRSMIRAEKKKENEIKAEPEEEIKVKDPDNANGNNKNNNFHRAKSNPKPEFNSSLEKVEEKIRNKSTGNKNSDQKINRENLIYTSYTCCKDKKEKKIIDRMEKLKEEEKDKKENEQSNEDIDTNALTNAVKKILNNIEIHIKDCQYIFSYEKKNYQKDEMIKEISILVSTNNSEAIKIITTEFEKWHENKIDEAYLKIKGRIEELFNSFTIKFECIGSKNYCFICTNNDGNMEFFYNENDVKARIWEQLKRVCNEEEIKFYCPAREQKLYDNLIANSQWFDNCKKNLESKSNVLLNKILDDIENTLKNEFKLLLKTKSEESQEGYIRLRFENKDCSEEEIIENITKCVENKFDLSDFYVNCSLKNAVKDKYLVHFDNLLVDLNNKVEKFQTIIEEIFSNIYVWCEPNPINLTNKSENDYIYNFVYYGKTNNNDDDELPLTEDEITENFVWDKFEDYDFEIDNEEILYYSELFFLFFNKWVATAKRISIDIFKQISKNLTAKIDIINIIDTNFWQTDWEKYNILYRYDNDGEFANKDQTIEVIVKRFEDYYEKEMSSCFEFEYVNAKINLLKNIVAKISKDFFSDQFDKLSIAYENLLFKEIYPNIKELIDNENIRVVEKGGDYYFLIKKNDNDKEELTDLTAMIKYFYDAINDSKYTKSLEGLTKENTGVVKDFLSLIIKKCIEEFLEKMIDEKMEK